MFSDIQDDALDIKIGETFYHFEHGHRFFFNQKDLRLKNFYYLIDKIPGLGKLVCFLTNMSYRYFSKRVSKNKVATKRNEYVKNIKPKDVYYVIGHTHMPEHDKKNKFINTGCIMENLITYLIIDDIGNPQLIIEKIN